jgi:hypothetical protein
MFRTLIIFGVLLAIGTVARASQITHEVNYNGTVPGSETVQLPKYNGAETLTGVQLILESYARDGSITWDNESDIISLITLGIGTRARAVGPDATTLTTMPMRQQTQSNVGVDDELGAPADFSGYDSFTVYGGIAFDQTSTNASDLTPYMGVGLFDVNITSTVAASHSARGGSGETQAIGGTTDGKVKVIYAFDAVPEPATMSLLAIGGIAALVRRRKS